MKDAAKGFFEANRMIIMLASPGLNHENWAIRLCCSVNYVLNCTLREGLEALDAAHKI